MTFHSIPVLSKFIRQLDRDTLNHGLQVACSNVLKSSKAKFEIKGKTAKLKTILRTKPVVVVANHPTNSEVLVLIASLESRQDLFLVISARFTNISQTLNKHFIPVYVTHNHREGRGKGLKYYLLTPFLQQLNFSPEEEHQKNIESIELAIEKVKKGGLVIIFPEKRHGDRGWQSGLGYLLKGLQETEAYLVQAYIHGTSDKDFFRLITFFSKFLPKVTTFFAPPLKIKDALKTKTSPKTIVKSLEEKYKKWVNGLDS